jgi:hypothetical protein
VAREQRRADANHRVNVRRVFKQDAAVDRFSDAGFSHALVHAGDPDPRFASLGFAAASR